MRVLQINSVCGVGSTGKIAVGIHNLLKSKGHGSCIAYGRGVPRNCDSTIKIGNRIDNYMHVALTRLFDRHGFGSKRATRKFIKKIKQYNPDIIHLHNIHGYYLNVKILFDFLKSTNIPTVWTLHDCWSYTGHCAYYTYLNCEKWKSHCMKCPGKKNYPASMLFDRSNKNYSQKQDIFSSSKNITIVTPSVWLKKEVRKSYLSHFDVNVISNGIDINMFKPSTGNNFRVKNKLMNKKIILGVASIWEARKGLVKFIELSDVLNDDECIVIVGKIPDKESLNAQRNNILHIERTENQKELAAIYSAADLYFNPTLEDNYPTTNLEALACGCPVLTFWTGGSPEAICESNGRVIKSDTIITDIISIIRKMLSKDKYIPQRISKLAQDNHNQCIRYDSYIDLYEKVCIETNE